MGEVWGVLAAVLSSGLGGTSIGATRYVVNAIDPLSRGVSMAMRCDLASACCREGCPDRCVPGAATAAVALAAACESKSPASWQSHSELGDVLAPSFGPGKGNIGHDLLRLVFSVRSGTLPAVPTTVRGYARSGPCTPGRTATCSPLSALHSSDRPGRISAPFLAGEAPHPRVAGHYRDRRQTVALQPRPRFAARCSFGRVAKHPGRVGASERR